jgi:hypothetical protein
MTVKQLLKAATGALAMLGILVLAGGNTAAAAPAKSNNKSVSNVSAHLNLVHEQFSATGVATSFSQTITNPPQIGQGFILEENLLNPSNVVIGTDHIECKIISFTPTSLRFACKADYAFTNGATLKGVTTFNFDLTSVPNLYDAYILSGTGAYAGAKGVVHVTDFGPGNPTGYVFDFYHL